MTQKTCSNCGFLQQCNLGCGLPDGMQCPADEYEANRDWLLESIEIVIDKTSRIIPDRKHIKALFEVVQACQLGFNKTIDDLDKKVKELERVTDKQ